VDKEIQAARRRVLGRRIAGASKNEGKRHGKGKGRDKGSSGHGGLQGMDNGRRGKFRQDTLLVMPLDICKLLGMTFVLALTVTPRSAPAEPAEGKVAVKCRKQPSGGMP